MIVLWDVLRIVAAVAALVVLAVTPFAVIRTPLVWHQKARFIGLAMLGPPVIGGYLTQLGTVPDQGGWRTVLIATGLVVAAAGMVGYWRAPARHRR